MKTGENRNEFITEDYTKENVINNQAHDENNRENINRYLYSISNFKKLSKEEVIKLYQDLSSEDETIKQKTRETLINCNLQLVWSRAKKIISSTYHPFFLDAIAEGNLALIEKVIPNFDPNMGYQFSSYAVPVIDEAIRKALAFNNMSMFKKGSVPGFLKVKRVFQELEAKNQFPPSLDQLNKELRKKKITRKVTKATYNALFIHTKQGSLEYLDEDPENGLSRYELIADPRAEQNFNDELKKIDFQRVLKEAMASKFLKEREIKILRERYENNKSLREIAKEYNLSAERIKQILEIILGKLRRKIISLGINEKDFFD